MVKWGQPPFIFSPQRVSGCYMPSQIVVCRLVGMGRQARMSRLVWDLEFGDELFGGEAG